MLYMQILLLYCRSHCHSRQHFQHWGKVKFEFVSQIYQVHLAATHYVLSGVEQKIISIRKESVGV